MSTLFNSPAAMALFDSVAPVKPASPDKTGESRVLMDAAAYAAQDVAVKATAAVQTWIGTDDLDEGEGAADRLIAMLVGIADDNKDGELSADEQDVVQVAANAAWDYMAGKGVSDDDLGALFNGDDAEVSNAAGARVIEFLADAVPDGDEASTDDANDAVFDSANWAAYDAVYKKRMVVRGGKKIRVNRRISGHVRLSAKQKISIRKMLRKSHNAGATMHRMKSNRVRKSMGMNR